MHRFGLLAVSSISTLAFALASPAVAQDQSAPESSIQDDDPSAAPSEQVGTISEDGTIIVTGSRILRDPNATAPSPITTVTAADIRSTGQTDVAEVLREIPALIASGTVEDSIERGGGGIGQATLNLRGLGSNRTLVLVNGRRHVSGVSGAQTVDIATIPRSLIQRVDVLTGGASSIYGADAVTGVVNFVLRNNYDGLEATAQSGISSKGDGASYSTDVVWGKNFFNGRANLTIAGSYALNEELKMGDRDFARDNIQASAGLTYQHPDRRFQQGDITAATPNFQQRYSLAAGRFPWGFAIPTPAQFAAFFPGQTPTPAEQALMDRALNSPSHILGRDPRFAISSPSGLIARADFDYFNLDIDNDGVNDCFQSLIGWAFAQCYITTKGGGIRPFEDGLIATFANQLGGDGIAESSNHQSLIPRSQRYDINLLGHYEFSPAARLFAELKYVHTDTFSRPINVNTFYDLLYIAPDNPFIPAVLQPSADDAGGLLMSRDFEDIPSTSRADRDTYRAVVGFDGNITDNLRYTIYGNYGRTESEIDGRSVLPDRLFAAIDVVAGPGGQPVCASNIDPTRVHPGSEYFPVITPGFFTFTPGANSGCIPINLFDGPNSVTREAMEWVSTITTTQNRIDQLTFAGELAGDTGRFFNMPGGAIQFALGAEYRRERSRTEFDPLVLGLLPAGSPAGPAGTFVGDIDPNKKSLTFDTTTQTLNTGGKFDVREVFGEVRIPILRDLPFVHELSVEGAARYSDYSTIGGATTWNVNGIFAPIRDVRFRGTYAQAIRAPNIAELFNPQQGAVFRPIDPCDVNVINSLLASPNPGDVERGQRAQANCAAAGAPPGYTDPLTARFSGTTGGNPDLTEETARTWTAGAVIQPRFIPGLTISGDYYNIEIEDAIAPVSAQNIVNQCYQGATFPNQYCALIERGPNFGFSFLRQTALNFGRFETAGVDASISYNFNLGRHRFALSGSGNWTQKVDLFFDPGDPDLVDPELGEQGYPEWSGVASATWSLDRISLTYRLQYIGKMALAGVEIERQDIEFGPAGTGPEYFIHDVSAAFDVNDRFTLYGGINNLTDEEPFANRVAYPVSPLGRFFFIGVRARIM